MIKYLRTLWTIFSAAARSLGRVRLGLVIGFGIGARLSLLITFVLVVHLAVRTLKQVGIELPYPFSLITLDPRFILPLSFVVVPALFYFAGWTMLYSQKIAAEFINDFVFETRRSNMRMAAPSLLVEPLPSRRKHVQEFVSRGEPDVARAARGLLGGLITLSQCVVICGALFAALAIVNWKILLTVTLLIAIVVPRYIKSSYIWHLEDQKRIAETGRQLREEHKTIMEGPGLVEGDPNLIQEALFGYLDGETTRKEAHHLLDRQLAPRRILPFLYANLGLVVGMLLYETTHMGSAEKAQAVGQFATTLMVLRFLVGEVASALGAVRQIHTGYPLADKICAALRRPFDQSP